MKGRDRFNDMQEARRNRIEIGPVRTRNMRKSREPKPWVVMLTRPSRPRPWRFGAYRTKEIADTVARKCERTYAILEMRATVLRVDDPVSSPADATAK